MINGRMIRGVLGSACLLLLASPAFRTIEAQTIKLKAKLVGVQEVPSVLTPGGGEFTATVDPTGGVMTFTLTYSDLQADATQSHIHFGQPGANGGIMVWFCSNLTPPASPRRCSLRSGTVEGTLTFADVVGPFGQGIDPADFNDVISAILTGNTYANVHTTRSPGGEIRGRVKHSSGSDRHD